MSFRKEIRDRVTRLENDTKVRQQDRSKKLYFNGFPYYKTKHYNVAKVLGMLLDDLGYEIVDDGVVLRKKGGDHEPED